VLLNRLVFRHSRQEEVVESDLDFKIQALSLVARMFPEPSLSSVVWHPTFARDEFAAARPGPAPRLHQERYNHQE
jgi:hypothetical protein